jgi:hypothetical protein
VTAFAKLPKKVWVGTQEFYLRVEPRTHPVLAPHEKDQPNSDGMTVFDESPHENVKDWKPWSIYLSDDLSLPMGLETLWHELTHAINWAYDIEDGAEEEYIADKHGKAWSQFWIANPRFARWWNSQCVAIRKERAHA